MSKSSKLLGRIKSQTSLIVSLIAATVMIAVPFTAYAAQITDRKITLSDSDGAATGVGYTFASAALPTSDVLQSVKIEFCTTASGACSAPAGFSTSSSTLSSQPTGVGDAAGWTVDASDANELRISKTGNVAAPSGAVSIAWGGVVNPTADNTTFFGRVTTYTGDDWSTGATDTGTVAVSTGDEITVTASVGETLTFCVAQTGITTTSCAGASGSTVALGSLGTSTTGSGTSQMGIATNAGSGYAISYIGTTLTDGGNTIDAMTGAANTSTQGTEEFGFNLRDNATPDVGVEPDGAGNGAPADPYDDVDEFFFQSGDTIATDADTESFRRFHHAYIANISSGTEPGSYEASLTYIATATF